MWKDTAVAKAEAKTPRAEEQKANTTSLWCPLTWQPPAQACLVTDSFLRLSIHFLPPFPSSLSIQGSVWPLLSRSLL